jgi:hypothetical protein
MDRFQDGNGRLTCTLDSFWRWKCCSSLPAPPSRHHRTQGELRYAAAHSRQLTGITGIDYRLTTATTHQHGVQRSPSHMHIVPASLSRLETGGSSKLLTVAFRVARMSEAPPRSTGRSQVDCVHARTHARTHVALMRARLETQQANPCARAASECGAANYESVGKSQPVLIMIDARPGRGVREGPRTSSVSRL